MRLIDADALTFIHEIARSLDDGHNWNELCITADEIAEAPTIEPKRGEWKWTQGGMCSECGFHNSNFDYNFCPNCGCDMREREGE